MAFGGRVTEIFEVRGGNYVEYDSPVALDSLNNPLADGFYWFSSTEVGIHGPFNTREEANVARWK